MIGTDVRAGTWPPRRVLPRTVAALVLSSLVAALLAAPTRAVAAGSDSLSFGEGAAGTFGANEVVRVDGRLTYETRCPGGVPDFVYPATDVYIVAAVPGEGGELRDVAGGPPNTIVSTASLFIGEIIAVTAPTGSLEEGAYSVVYDTCQDGKFDGSVDTIFADAITVRLPAVLPGASIALVDLKGAAEEEAHSWVKAHALFETIEKVKDIPDLVGCMMSPDTDCITGILIGEASGGFAFTAGVSEGFKQLMVSQAKHYAAIAADPPDQDFRRVTRIRAVPDTPGGDGEPLTDALADLLVPLAGQGALAEALLHAVERYQGAQAAGDAEWALTHARQAADLADALSAQVEATGRRLEQLREVVRAAPGDVDAAYEEARAHVQRVWYAGFTPDERRQLFNLGLSAAEVADRETKTRRAYPIGPVTRAGIVAQIDELLAAQAGTAAALEHAGSAFGALVADLEAQPAVPDVAPTAAAGGPYSTVHGAATALDATGSSTPDGTTITAYEWDTDADGAFDDAVGASPSVILPATGSRLVGLRVVNSLGRESVSYARAMVMAAGAAPDLTSPVPATGNVAVTVGTPRTFTIGGPDADGGVIAYRWFVDGAEVEADGRDLHYAPSAADVGTHVVEVRVSQGTASPSSSWRWDVAVIDVDGDGDGWTLTSDCDDSDGAISPGSFERAGNGVDDDCDTGTADAPPGGLTGTPWLWGSNHLGQIGIGSSAAVVRPPVELTGYDDVVQVESGFRLNLALRGDGRVVGMGSNFYGDIGDGTSTHRGRPVAVIGVDGLTPELTGVTEISTGGSSPHTAARRVDGTVVAWGENRNRQLGDGSTSNYKPYPVRVLSGPGGEPLDGVRSVESGSDQTYAHLEDGTVRTWGHSICRGHFPRNEPYPVEISALGADTRQVSAGYSWVLFRMADGSVLSCGGNSNALGRKPTLQEPAYDPHPVTSFGPGSGVIDVSAGYESGVALKADGSVWMWGWNGNGSMTATGTPTATTYTPLRVPLPPGPPVVDVENAEACHTQALRADGSVLIWGCDTHGSSGIVPAGTVTAPTVLQLPAAGLSTSSSIWNGMVLARPVNDVTWERPAFWVEASVADASTAEGGEGGFEVSLSEALPHDVTVTWDVETGTAGTADLDLSGGTTTVPAGSTSVRIPAPVIDDFLHEDDETYTLTVTDVSHGIQVARSQAAGLVADDDDAPTVSVAPIELKEGSTSLTDAVVTLRLSEESGLPVTVDLATLDGSAVAPGDYTSTQATVTVPAGDTTGEAHIPVHGDRTVEPAETFSVRLSSPVGATLGNPEADVAIIDDEPLSLVVTTPTVVEGDGGGTTTATFQVSLEPTPPGGTTVEVPWTIEAGTAAVPGDVRPDSGTLELDADGPARVTAHVVADDDFEQTESFRLVLGRPTATDDRDILPGDVAPGVILDDDPADVAPTVEVGADIVGDEGADVAVHATVTDPDSSPAVRWTATPESDVDARATCVFADDTAASTTVRCTDDGTYVLTATADDGTNTPVSDDVRLTVDNVAPRIRDIAVAVTSDGTREVEIRFTDPGDDAHECTFDWGDATASLIERAVSPCRGAHQYPAGSHILTVEVRDDDGGRAGAHRTLLVYAFDGFFPPVHNPPNTNAVTAGQAIPVKFSLHGYQGMDIFADSKPASHPVSCESGDPLEPRTPTQMPGSDNLTYAPGSDRYLYVWKTERSWAGTCRQFVVGFKDGSQRTAMFHFR